MPSHFWRRLSLRVAISTVVYATLVMGSLSVSACHGLLDVSDPTLIQDPDIANAGGANGRRLDVVYAFSTKLLSTGLDVAMFTDEAIEDYSSAPARPGDNPWLNLDRRDDALIMAQAAANDRDDHLAALDDIFSKSSVALAAMYAYGADSVKGDPYLSQLYAAKNEYLAQLYAMRSYVILQMAEDICPGFPINDISADNQPVYSGPYSTDSATAYALAQADSALAQGRDSTRFLNFAQVVKGRALLNLGRYAEAAAAVSTVPTTFTYTTDPSQGNSFIYLQYLGGGVGERDGGNGLPFVSASDPRVPTTFLRTRFTVPSDSVYNQQKYASGDPVIVTSGVEARLIEAEAAINAGDPNWLTILNTLRESIGMADLTDPGTTTAQVDLLYQERAFWLYMTGRRLGDLRRLIRNYGRGAETVFPTGAYPLGGLSYGSATAIPFTLSVQAKHNSKITAGCTTR